MPIPRPNRFSSYTLTPDEERSGATLTELQVCHIQNLICDFATEKVSLLYTPENPLAFTQREAELQGKIIILEYLLQLSEAATTENLKIAINTAASQSDTPTR